MLVALIGTMLVVIAIAAAFSHRAGLQESNELFDAKLAHSARVLMSLVDDALQAQPAGNGLPPVVIQVWHGDDGKMPTALVSAGGHAYETKLAFQARAADGRLLLRSESGPERQFAPLEPGFVDVDIDGLQWRVFTLRAPSGHWYQAGELSDIRAEIAEEIAAGTITPLLIALPTLALLVWAVITWACGFLVRVSSEIHAREVGKLSPLAIRRVPVEIQGLVSAVNDLLARLDAALGRERQLIADAAHELRTPVAALKIHAENLRSAGSDAERRDSQRRVEAGVARLERAIAQLLTLSRVESAAATAARVEVDLRAVVRSRLDDLSHLAAERDIRLQLALAPATVPGDQVALEAMVRNVLENALRYSPIGGTVAVRLEVNNGRAVLVIEDAGPGIPADARERVFERFHRELGTEVEGSGLGLAIVAQVLKAHGGTIALDQSPTLTGLRVQVTLPA
ncbi:MAG: sensor histidine kinase N-terminal domain-containing protein [Arenimonas sp.]|nr:sensor histidine kinase N-terminal domain-containing protein [Arenimonas sp.]